MPCRKSRLVALAQVIAGVRLQDGIEVIKVPITNAA
jgi:hypothetical protein